MELTEERRRYIDSLPYLSLLEEWRFAPAGDEWFQGETGRYWSERMKELRAAPGGAGMHTAASKLLG